jgi:hypothetical protein
MIKVIAEAYLFPFTSVGMIERDGDGNYRWVDEDEETWVYGSLDDIIGRIQSIYEEREILVRPTKDM